MILSVNRMLLRVVKGGNIAKAGIEQKVGASKVISVSAGSKDRRLALCL